MNTHSRHLRTTAALLLACMIILPGCASKYGPQLTQVNFYPQCYRPIGDLRAAEESTNKSTAGGAVAGALIGALIGGLATGKTEGALVGAAAGGATGAVAGNVYGKSQEKKVNQQYLNQLDGESAQMDRTSAAAKVAAKCYNNQFKQAVAQAKAGRISKIELTNRYEEIRSGLEETSRILNNTYSNMADKDAQYRQVMEQESGQAQYQPPSQNESRQTAKRPKKQPRPTQAATPEGQQVAQRTTKWQNSRENLDETRREVQEDLDSARRTMEALEG